MITLRLPIPPSTNGLYFNLPNRGRAKTKAYTAWERDADTWYKLQKLHLVNPIKGPCELHIRLPKIRGDISNRIKAPEDWLVSRGLTGDDKHTRKVTVEVDEKMQTRECWITIKATEQ